MTDTLIGYDTDSDGAGNSAIMQVDYDDVSQTIGVNMSTVGTCTVAVMSVAVAVLGKTYALDLINGQGGNLLNTGRVVLGGPGSVIGQTTPIAPGSFPLPPFGKGVAPPYVISLQWHQ